MTSISNIKNNIKILTYEDNNQSTYAPQKYRAIEYTKIYLENWISYKNQEKQGIFDCLSQKAQIEGNEPLQKFLNSLYQNYQEKPEMEMYDWLTKEKTNLIKTISKKHTRIDDKKLIHVTYKKLTTEYNQCAHIKAINDLQQLALKEMLNEVIKNLKHAKNNNPWEQIFNCLNDGIIALTKETFSPIILSNDPNLTNNDHDLTNNAQENDKVNFLPLISSYPLFMKDLYDNWNIYTVFQKRNMIDRKMKELRDKKNNLSMELTLLYCLQPYTKNVRAPFEKALKEYLNANSPPSKDNL